MDELDESKRRRARLPSEMIDPAGRAELGGRLAGPFQTDWARLEAAATLSDCLTLRSVGAFRAGDRLYDVPRALFTGPKSGGDPIRLALFAGLGGNDRLAREALVQFLLKLCGNPIRATGMELFCYPVPDPASVKAGMHKPHVGNSLAWAFWSGTDDPAVYFLERELGVFRFHGVIVLGSVPRAGGLGIHLDSSVLRSVLLRPLQEAAASVAGPDVREDSETSTGSACVGDAAAKLVESPELPTRAFGVTLCLPAASDQDRVCQSVAAVLETLIEHYAAVLPLGQDI